MLIGDSLPEYVFTRTAILGLRLVAPLSLLYCIPFATFRPHLFIRRPFPLLLSVWMISEASFFLAVYLPLKAWLQRPAVHPEPLGEPERRVLMQKCLEHISDPNFFLSKWFLDASPSEIKQENVKEFFAWSSMNKEYEDVSEAENAELDIYSHDLEAKLGRTFPPGRGKACSLRGTVDDVPMQHRPLAWYFIVSVMDCTTYIRLAYHGFRFRRQALAYSLATFPVRPIALFAQRSPAPRLSYWQRKHTSKKRLPVLFIHGIGIGLYTYVDFLARLNAKDDSPDNDGDVGVIAVEILPISARICAPALAATEMRNELKKILKQAGWEQFVLVGHSYGTAIAASILRDSEFSGRVKAAVLMDPICFLLSLPDVSYNFTRRNPSTASEYMLHYFSSLDPLISHSISRPFCWSELILFKQNVVNIPLTVTLSGRDIIVPAKAVWEYLTNSSPGDDVPDESQRFDGDTTEWENGSMRVLWFDKLNHAGLFASRGLRRGVAGIVQPYCEPDINGLISSAT